MSEEKINNKGKDDDKERIVDITTRIELVTTKDAPYHKEGEKISVSPVVAEIMLKNKWAKKAD